SINGKINSEKFIINTGNSSCTTKEVLNGFDTWVKIYDPKIVSLMIGMNDCATDTNVTIEQYESNLIEIIRKTREIGAVIILQTPNYTLPAPNGTSNGQKRDRLEEYLDVARKVATEEKVMMVDNHKYWLEREKTSHDVGNKWFNDWIHPNEVGHLELAKLMFEELGLNTEDSYTANMSYPIKVQGDNGKYIEKSATYPEYKGLDYRKPVVNYKVNRQFMRSGYIDKSSDLDKIKDLSTGAIVTRFNVTDPRAAQTIFSMTDSNDPDSSVTLAVNENGKIHFSVKNNGENKVIINTSTQGYNDGNWHTLLVNVEEANIVIYVDGIKIHSQNISGFFSSVETPDVINIGRNKNNDENGKWEYYGGLSYVDIYDKPLKTYEIIELTTENQMENTDSIASIFTGNIGNRTVFLGDEVTAGKGDTFGYKNYVEYLEERIRGDYGHSFDARSKYFINSGVEGATSGDILNNFERWATLYEPKAVFLMTGGNEVISTTEFEVNLNLIVDKIESIGAVPVLQTPTIEENNIEEYVNIIKKVGDERGLAVIDHYSYWNSLNINQPNLKTSWTNSDYDPNHRGQLEIAKKILKDIGLYSSGSAIGRFNIPNPGDNLEQLKEEARLLINDTKDLLETITEGYMTGDYLVGSKDIIMRDVRVAEEEISKGDTNIQNVTKVMTNINQGIKELEDNKVITALGDVNRDGNINTSDLSLVSGNIGKNSESVDWEIASQYDLNLDGLINKDDLYIIRDIIFK
ncbi:MAG: GDSL-type esterase/lipase family protein, partial [Clostridium sp.]